MAIFKSWILGFALSAFLLTACSSSSAQIEKLPARKLTVLSTIAMIDDIVGQVGGERIEHTPLIRGDIDPHSYEIVKGDDEKISSSDIVFYNGLSLEHGASLCYKLQKHPLSIGLGDYIKEHHPEAILTGDGGQVDPHVWMDIATWSYIVDPIAEALSQKDPEGKALYWENAGKVKDKMLAVHQRIYEAIQAVPEEKRFLVTSHDAFGYFAKSYLSTPKEKEAGDWKKRFAAPEGLAPDGQLSAKDIQAIIDHLAAYRVAVVFPESNVSQDSLKKIVSACKEKKQNVRFSTQVLYGDAMGAYDSQDATYLGMIEHNVNTLIKEWK